LIHLRPRIPAGILIEASWHYRKRAEADLIMKRRRMGQNPQIDRR